MKSEDIQALVENQRSYFRGGATLPVEARLSVLKCLLRMVEQNEATIIAALQADLGKGVTEATMCEIGMVKSALRHMIKNVRRYARDKVVMTPLAQFPALSIKKPAPYGNESVELSVLAFHGAAHRSYCRRQYGGAETECVCTKNKHTVKAASWTPYRCSLGDGGDRRSRRKQYAFITAL